MAAQGWPAWVVLGLFEAPQQSGMPPGALAAGRAVPVRRRRRDGRPARLLRRRAELLPRLRAVACATNLSPLKAGLTTVAFSVAASSPRPSRCPLLPRRRQRVSPAAPSVLIDRQHRRRGPGRPARRPERRHGNRPGLVVSSAAWPLVRAARQRRAGHRTAAEDRQRRVRAARRGGSAWRFGVALFSAVPSSYLGRHSFEAALVHSAAPYAMGAFALCGVLSLLYRRGGVGGGADAS